MESPAIPAPRKARPGCLIQVARALALGLILVVAIMAVFTPWGFFMGGHFHINATWKGWGRMHSTASGGDYLLFVRFFPGRGSRGVPHVRGTGVLCTPRGERYNLTVGGDFEKHVGTDLQGKKAYLYMSNSSMIARNFGGDTRPSLDLHGKWSNPDLVMDDKGSISRNFEPDGSLYKGHSTSHPYNRETVQVTLHEGSKSDFDAACAAILKR